MRVQVGKIAPAAHVGGLVEDTQQGSCQAATGGTGGQFLGSLDDGDGEGRHERSSRPAPLLRQRVESAAVLTHEVVRVELRPRVAGPRGGHPAGDLAVGQAGSHLLRGAEHAAALFLRSGDDAGHLIGSQRVSVIAQDLDRGVITGAS